MFQKSAIDMSRPHLLYGAGLGVLMLLSLAVSNIPALSFSAYVDLVYRKELCAALFALGAVMGCAALSRHVARSKHPWRVPQSQVALPYAVFFITTLMAISIAH
jgi:hypothetical protein